LCRAHDCQATSTALLWSRRVVVTYTERGTRATAQPVAIRAQGAAATHAWRLLGRSRRCLLRAGLHTSCWCGVAPGWLCMAMARLCSACNRTVTQLYVGLGCPSCPAFNGGFVCICWVVVERRAMCACMCGSARLCSSVHMLWWHAWLSACPACTRIRLCLFGGRRTASHLRQSAIACCGCVAAPDSSRACACSGAHV